MKAFFFFAALQFLLGTVAAQSPAEGLHKTLAEIHRRSPFPGFALAVVRPDTVLFAEGYGWADRQAKKPYTVETVQPVGSVSKTVVGLALMMAVELGYFSLETPVNEVLPFRVVNPCAPDEPIRVKHLATHTSSLLDNDTAYLQAYVPAAKPGVELAAFLQSYYTPGGQWYSATNFGVHKPGAAYAYSNVASALAALLVETKSGMPFHQFTRQRIFMPLQMSSTGWFDEEVPAERLATLYQIGPPDALLDSRLLNADKTYRRYSCVTYPDGSLRTSVADLSRYLQTMMRGYFTGIASVLDSASFGQLFAPRFAPDSPPLQADPKEPNRGLFWAYSRKGDIRHTGSDPGVFAVVSFNPANRTGRVFLMNCALDGEDNEKAVESFQKMMAAVEKFEQQTAARQN